MIITKKKTSSVKALENALVHLLVENPLSDITIQRLCNEAGINRSTFYLHFHDLKQLVKYIESDIKESISVKLNGQEGLAVQLNALMELVKEKKMFFKVFLDPKNNGEVKRYLDEHVMKAIKIEYDLSANSSRNKYLEVFLISGLWYMTFEWIQSNCDLDPLQLSELMISFVGNSVNAN